MSRQLALCLTFAVATTPLAAVAGPEKVAFPENHAGTFVRYATVDKPEREPPIIRFLYINTETLAAARPGEPLPYGTVVVMEDHEAELTNDGEPVLDTNGRFVPTDEITNIFVQQKRQGWGAEYSAEKRNGEWEYAWFRPDGTRRADKSMDSCFECHKRVEGQNFTFTTWPFVARIKNDQAP